MYAPFNVPELLGRPLEVSLTKDSGVAGLVFLIRQHLGVELPKDDPDLLDDLQLVVSRVRQWATNQHRMGRTRTDCASAFAAARLIILVVAFYNHILTASLFFGSRF